MKILVFTGAGVSAESGIPTYRDTDGLWYEHKVEDVATAHALAKKPQKVYDFFNMMRKKLDDHQPNEAHIALADLQKEHEVVIITQNVDDLHERAGSERVIHLHGCLRNMRTSKNPPLYYPYDVDIKVGMKDIKQKSQLRPDVVLFGESVPSFNEATRAMDGSNVLVVIGTTLDVYPAAGIVDIFSRFETPIFYIDPRPNFDHGNRITYIQKKATEGMADLVEALRKIPTED
jgi:NAD-dependent deacetylase